MRMDLLRAESGMGRWTCRVHLPRVNMLRCMQLRQPDAVLWANAWCHLMRSCIQQRHLLPVLAVDVLGRLAVEHPVNHAYGCARRLQFYTLRYYRCRFFRSAGNNSLNARERKDDTADVRGIMPVINQNKIHFVLDKFALRGPTWAREFMNRIEGFALWSQHLQAVQAAERVALE